MEEDDNTNENGSKNEKVSSHSSPGKHIGHVPKNLSIQTLDNQWDSIESNINNNGHKNIKFVKYSELFPNEQCEYNKEEPNEFNFKHIIHPYDTEFDEFCQFKIDYLEKLKSTVELQDDEVSPLSLKSDISPQKKLNSLIKNQNIIQGIQSFDTAHETKPKKTFLLNEDDINVNSKKKKIPYSQTSDSLFFKDKDPKENTFKSKIDYMYNYIGKPKEKKKRYNAKPYTVNNTIQNEKNEKEDAFDTLFKGYLNDNSKLHGRNKRVNSLKNLKIAQYPKRSNDNNKTFVTLNNERGTLRTMNNDDSIDSRINTNVYRKIEDNKKLIHFLFKNKT